MGLRGFDFCRVVFVSRFIIQEPSFKLFLEVMTLLEVGLAVSVVFGAFLFGHGLSDWRRGLIGFLFAFFDFGESGIQFWVGVAHMVAIAGLAGHQGVAEVVEACVDGLGGGCRLPKVFHPVSKRTSTFLALPEGFFRPT